jgi:hypothetical protein
MEEVIDSGWYVQCGTCEKWLLKSHVSKSQLAKICLSCVAEAKDSGID